MRVYGESVIRLLLVLLFSLVPPTIPGEDVPTPEVPHDEDFSQLPHHCGG